MKRPSLSAPYTHLWLLRLEWVKLAWLHATILIVTKIGSIHPISSFAVFCAVRRSWIYPSPMNLFSFPIPFQSAVFILSASLSSVLRTLFHFSLFLYCYRRCNQLPLARLACITRCFDRYWPILHTSSSSSTLIDTREDADGKHCNRGCLWTWPSLDPSTM